MIRINKIKTEKGTFVYEAEAKSLGIIVRHANRQKALKKIAQSWFRKFKGQYNRANLFEVEDLEQEIWAELLESSYVTKEILLREIERICDKHRKRGDRQPVEIPVSQLDRDERAHVNNLFYGISAGEDDYSEESYP